MKTTIHQAYTIQHPRTIPPSLQLTFCGDTLQETVDYIASNGGGIYRNELHNFQFRVEAKLWTLYSA